MDWTVIAWVGAAAAALLLVLALVHRSSRIAVGVALALIGTALSASIMFIWLGVPILIVGLLIIWVGYRVRDVTHHQPMG